MTIFNTYDIQTNLKYFIKNDKITLKKPIITIDNFKINNNDDFLLAENIYSNFHNKLIYKKLEIFIESIHDLINASKLFNNVKGPIFLKFRKVCIKSFSKENEF